jgi:DNA-binding response OmpR family regulator
MKRAWLGLFSTHRTGSRPRRALFAGRAVRHWEFELRNGGLRGALVLVVEDEWDVAEETSGILRRAGCRVLGPAPSVAAALDLLEDAMPDAALLEAALGPQMYVAVADRLQEQGVPFAFLGGHGNAGLPVGYDEHRMLSKPLSPAALQAEVLALLSAPTA